MNDAYPQNPDGTREACELCGMLLEFSGDNWDGLCPNCADAVSEYLDRNLLDDEDRDSAIELIRRLRSKSS
jgi:hypothetical protein